MISLVNEGNKFYLLGIDDNTTVLAFDGTSLMRNGALLQVTPDGNKSIVFAQTVGNNFISSDDVKSYIKVSDKPDMTQEPEVIAKQKAKIAAKEAELNKDYVSTPLTDAYKEYLQNDSLTDTTKLAHVDLDMIKDSIKSFMRFDPKEYYQMDDYLIHVIVSSYKDRNKQTKKVTNTLSIKIDPVIQEIHTAEMTDRVEFLKQKKADEKRIKEEKQLELQEKHRLALERDRAALEDKDDIKLTEKQQQSVSDANAFFAKLTGQTK